MSTDGISGHETSTQGNPDTGVAGTAAVTPSAATHTATTHPTELPHAPHEGITRRDLLLVSVASVILSRLLPDVDVAGRWADIKCSKAAMPSPPPDSKISFLVVENPAKDRNAFHFRTYLADHYRDSVAIVDACRSPDDGEMREWLDSHPSARAIVVAEELDHLRKPRVRMRVVTKGASGSSPAKDYDVDDALGYLDQLLLAAHDGIGNEREQKLRTTANIQFPRASEADQSVDKLLQLANIPSLAKNWQLHLEIVDAYLFAGLPLEARAHLKKAMALCAEEKGIVDGVFYRQAAIDNELARRNSDDSELMRSHQNAAIRSCELGAELKPRGKYFPVTIAKLVEMQLQRPDEELNVVNLRKLEGYLLDASEHLEASDDPTATKYGLFMTLSTQQKTIPVRRANLESRQKAVERAKSEVVPVREQVQLDTPRKPARANRRDSGTYRCKVVTHRHQYRVRRCIR